MRKGLHYSLSNTFLASKVHCHRKKLLQNFIEYWRKGEDDGVTVIVIVIMGWNYCSY